MKPFCSECGVELKEEIYTCSWCDLDFCENCIEDHESNCTFGDEE